MLAKKTVSKSSIHLSELIVRAHKHLRAREEEFEYLAIQRAAQVLAEGSEMNGGDGVVTGWQASPDQIAQLEEIQRNPGLLGDRDRIDQNVQHYVTTLLPTARQHVVEARGLELGRCLAWEYIVKWLRSRLATRILPKVGVDEYSYADDGDAWLRDYVLTASSGSSEDSSTEHIRKAIARLHDQGASKELIHELKGLYPRELKKMGLRDKRSRRSIGSAQEETRGQPQNNFGRRGSRITKAEKRIMDVLNSNHHNQSSAAKELGITRQRVSQVNKKVNKKVAATKTNGSQSIKADQTLPRTGISSEDCVNSDSWRA
jgi:predicted DNA-binding protein (UPF0251 family)